MRILAGTPTLERYRSSRLIAYRDFDVIVELNDWGDGDEGVLVAHGDVQGGYLLAVEDGRLTFVFNSYGRISRVSGVLPPGVRGVTLRAAATADVRWNFTVGATTDAGEVVVAELPRAFQLVGMAPWTGISVGLDARGPVDLDLRLRRGVFRAPPSLTAVTYLPGEVRVPEVIREAIDAHAEDLAD